VPASLPPTDSLAGRGAVAPTRLLTDAELSQLAGYPDEIASEDLATFFRLDGEDRRWVVEDHRGPSNQLGLALQLCTLPWLGFVPDELTAAPAAAVSRLADQLATGPGALAGYGGWKDRTRTEHLRQVLARLGWATARPGALKVLDDFLLARALEHDSPALLTQLAGEHLRAERVVRPAPGELLRRVTTARARAGAETAHRLAPLLAADRSAELDRLLAVDPDVGVSRLVWLRRGATSATADVIKTELDKLSFLRALDADTLDLSVLPPARRRFLAQLGRRSTAQALARSDPDRRHPILLATLAETAVEILDELVTLFDQALAVADSRARHQLADRLADQARAGADSCWTVCSTCSPTPTWRTRPSAACYAAGSAGSGCAALAAPRRRARHATTGTSSCSAPATTTCGHSPRRCWPRCHSPAARTPPPCSLPWTCCVS